MPHRYRIKRFNPQRGVIFIENKKKQILAPQGATYLLKRYISYIAPLELSVLRHIFSINISSLRDLEFDYESLGSSRLRVKRFQPSTFNF
jgi:hypothetical protein